MSLPGSTVAASVSRPRETSLPSMSAVTGDFGVGAAVRMFCFATFMSSSVGFSSSCSTHAPTARAPITRAERTERADDVRKDPYRTRGGFRIRRFYRPKAGFAIAAALSGTLIVLRPLLIVPPLFGTEIHDDQVGYLWGTFRCFYRGA